MAESILKHGTAEVAQGLRIHYAEAGEGERTIVLLHGFPQTSAAWRRVMPALADAGFRVIAPDYRGAGSSSRPLGGYDKRTMAADIRTLLRNHLKVEGTVAMVGHDIGLMVAYAYAESYRDEVTHLAVMDAPLPGTAVFDRIRTDPRVWQFSFHAVRDIPEMLVAGRERQYIQAFVHARIFNPAAFNDADLEIYASAYSAPGAMRAGFELYRAFDQDVRDNKEALSNNGKLKIPVLGLYGTLSSTGTGVVEMMKEVAENVTGVQAPETGHWIAEENPGFFTERLLRFLHGG